MRNRRPSERQLEWVHVSLAEISKIYDEKVKLIRKTPDYFFSMSGYDIFRKYRVISGVDHREAQLMIVISYHSVFLQKDMPIWGIHDVRGRVTLDRLEIKGYIQKFKVPKSSKQVTNRNGIILSPKGKAFIDGYEKYYDTYMRRVVTTGDLSDDRLAKRSHWCDVQRKRRQKLKRQIWENTVIAKKVPSAAYLEWKASTRK